MLAELRDFLKSLNVADHYYIGKIENSKERALGVYSSAHNTRVEAIGLQSTYDIAGVQLLLHWTKNMKESEEAARDLFAKIRYITNTAMGSVYVDYFRVTSGEPVFVGTDSNGVYEYVIMADVYYRR